jgi:hypothetical protein
MADKIKIDSYKPITITTLEDFNIDGVDNLKLFKVVGTYTENSGFDLQVPYEKDITVITTSYRVAWYKEG